MRKLVAHSSFVVVCLAASACALFACDKPKSSAEKAPADQPVTRSAELTPPGTWPTSFSAWAQPSRMHERPSNMQVGA
jgi:hypothetical protein